MRGGCASSEAGHHHRRISDDSLLNAFGELRLGISPVGRLPQELLLQVFEHLVDPSLVTVGFPDQRVLHPIDEAWSSPKPICRKDLRNVCLVSRKFKLAATTLLYRCAHLATNKSPWNFLHALTAHPDLKPLVRHISVPTYLEGLTDRFEFAFSKDKYNWTLKNRPPRALMGKGYFADCGEYIRGDLLRLLVSLVRNLQSLVIPQADLLDGPITKDLVLHNLTMLRITLMTPNEVLICVRNDHSAVDRTIDWLSPDTLGHRFPGLRRLEVYTPTGRWEANLITEEEEGACSPLKFVESLTMTTRINTGPAAWNLMSLERPIFHAFKLRTLKFDGPGRDCNLIFLAPRLARWNLNRFFLEKGDGLRTLSLDWECHRSPQGLYFGPAMRIDTLYILSNLKHLTISLQALFFFSTNFNEQVEALEADPDTELSKLFPPSLKTLRIAEYIPGVYEADTRSVEDDSDMDDSSIDLICEHNNFVYRFLQVLRSYWMPCAEGRELWLRRYADLDSLAWRRQDPMGRARIAWILGTSADEEGAFTFKRVPSLHEYDTDGSGWEDEEIWGVLAPDSIEREDEKSDGELDQV